MEIILENAVEEFYKKPSLEMVYFEAVSNSIYAGANDIFIKISIDSYNNPCSLLISIEDNGEGFNDRNFDKFKHLLKKESKNHKGLGRLVFLKYFDKIQISSIYDNIKRDFIFDNDFKGISDFIELNEITDNKTVLNFSGYKLEKVNQYDYLKPSYIKEKIIEKFYPHLYSLKEQKKELKITISLETNSPNNDYDFFNDTQIIDITQLPELESIEFPLDDLMFDNLTLKYLIVNDNSLEKSIITAICVDERTIPFDIIKKDNIPNGYKIIFILFSNYFIGKVDCSRQELTLDTFERRMIEKIFTEKVSDILNDKIPEIVERNKKINTNLIDKYPHLQGFFDEKSVGLIDRSITLETAHKRFIKAQQEILESTDLTDEQYNKSLEMSSRSLTEYVLYRNKIINKLKQIDIKSSEADIHNIIVPKGKILKNSNLMNDIYSNNAWLLDDKYMSYLTTLSDQKMSEIINEISFEEEKDNSRPDIAIIFSNDPEKNIKVDAVIVELKKLGLPLARKEEVISQLKQRARKISNLYPNKIQRIWFYGIVDIDKELRISLKEEKFIEIFSKGTVFYKEHDTIIDEDKDIRIPYGLFIINYEAFIQDAESRNSTFLNILKEELRKKTAL